MGAPASRLLARVGSPKSLRFDGRPAIPNCRPNPKETRFGLIRAKALRDTKMKEKLTEKEGEEWSYSKFAIFGLLNAPCIRGVNS